MSGEATRRGGIEFEYKTIADLRGDGYRINRGAGSKGFADIIAIKPGQQLYVACKRSGIISAAEWDDLVEVASWVGATPVLAVNGPRGRGVDYWRLTGRRVPRAPMGRQPAERFLVDELAPPEPSWHRQEWLDAEVAETLKIPELTPSPPLGDQTVLLDAPSGAPRAGKAASSADAGPPSREGTR